VACVFVVFFAQQLPSAVRQLVGRLVGTHGRERACDTPRSVRGSACVEGRCIDAARLDAWLRGRNRARSVEGRTRDRPDAGGRWRGRGLVATSDPCDGHDGATGDDDDGCSRNGDEAPGENGAFRRCRGRAIHVGRVTSPPRSSCANRGIGDRTSRGGRRCAARESPSGRSL
jgi:hypothetical protein